MRPLPAEEGSRCSTIPLKFARGIKPSKSPIRLELQLTMPLLQRLCGLLVLLSCLAVGSARRVRDRRSHANIMRPATAPLVGAPQSSFPVTSRNGTILPPYNTTFFFDQLIDHNNPSLGTFKQRFWHTWEFYEKGEI